MNRSEHLKWISATLYSGYIGLIVGLAVAGFVDWNWLSVLIVSVAPFVAAVLVFRLTFKQTD